MYANASPHMCSYDCTHLCSQRAPILYSYSRTFFFSVHLSVWAAYWSAHQFPYLPAHCLSDHADHPLEAPDYFSDTQSDAIRAVGLVQ